MYEINCRLNQIGFSQLGVTQSTDDIIEIVPMDILTGDHEFSEYVTRSNDDIGQRQIVSLVKIRAFHQDANLHETRQREIRDQCLKSWKVPDNVRRAPAFEDPQVCLNIFCLLKYFAVRWHRFG